MDMNQFNLNTYDTSKVSPDWTYDNLTEARKQYVDMIVEHAETHSINTSNTSFSRQQLKLVSLSFKDNDDVPNWIVKDHDRRATLGVYFVPEVAEKATGESPLNGLLKTNTVDADDFDDSYVDIDVEDMVAELESVPANTDSLSDHDLF
tara:strand:+ start:902 stop:1348 length:447 start_codon:yes stop_codon:yes gene_type:complete